MTEKEKKITNINTPAIPYGDMSIDEFFQKIYEAFEELGQYRAIGTVKGYERAIQSSIENYNLYREYKAKVQAFEAIGTVEEFKALKEKDNKDFQLLLKCVKESYPIFKGAYVELDVFMGDVMRRFTRDMKQY